MKRLSEIGKNMYMLTPGDHEGDFCPESSHWPVILQIGGRWTLETDNQYHGEYPSFEAARVALTLMYGAHSLTDGVLK